MVGWREQQIYDNAKRADIACTSMFGRRPKETNISPAKIYHEKLNDNKKFMRLKGYTDWHLSMGQDGNYERRYFRYQNQRSFDSEWYLYKGKGKRKAIIQMPEYSDMTCRVFLKILWVPPELANMGIATEVMGELLKMTDEVDQMAKANDKYDGKNITCGSFIISLIANSFVVREGHWDIEKIAKREDGLDWTASPNSKADNCPDATMMDEVSAPLPEDELRMSLKQLEKFYIGKLGFARCEELAFSTEFNWDTGRINRSLNISGRSVCYRRYPLLYPPSNLGEWEKEEESDN